MKITLTILITFILNAGAHVDVGDAGWVLEKDKNNIKVWTRESETMSMKSFKAVTIVKATTAQLVAVLNDVEAYPEWMSDLSYAEVLDEISENERYYYFEVDAPWPVSNRDNVVHYELEEDPTTNGYKITVTGMPEYLPEKPDIVRITKSAGTWLIIPRENGESEIVFEYSADPGGKLPAWAINIFIVDGPFKTLSNLKGFVKQDKYKN